MKRWNGWGDQSISLPITPSAKEMLIEAVGESHSQTSFSLIDLLKRVPKSPLPKHHLISFDAEQRVRHSRGQSLPDLIDLRSGILDSCTDGVAFPSTDENLQSLINYAKENDIKLIPYGGGTSVVGHLSPSKCESPILTISLSHMNDLRFFDEKSQLATFSAGITGPDLEAALRSHGYTLGHYPQSFEYSTLGGWVTTRSSGQQSLGYGRIEDLFAGGKLLTPEGNLVMPSFPASAAGPDLRQLVLGSEGRLGILSEVTVRVRKLPENEHFHALFFPEWDQAEQAVRTLSQSDTPLSMIRLSNALETKVSLALSGQEKKVKYLKHYLKFRNIKHEGCLLLIGFSGKSSLIKSSRQNALKICRKNEGIHLYQFLGNAWHRNRFKTPYLRNDLWDLGYAVDTLETAVTWDRVKQTMTDIEKALRNALLDIDERVLVFSHLSHVYSSGSSIYTTYLFRIAKTPEETLERWNRLKTSATKSIIKNQGTISHHHGVGEIHKPYLIYEKGDLGIRAIRNLCQTFDPNGIMNPGKLVR